MSATRNNPPRLTHTPFHIKQGLPPPRAPFHIHKRHRGTTTTAMSVLSCPTILPQLQNRNMLECQAAAIQELLFASMGTGEGEDDGEQRT